MHSLAPARCNLAELCRDSFLDVDFVTCRKRFFSSKVHNILWCIPIHPSPGGDLCHLHQDHHLPETEQDAKPQPAEEAETNKCHPSVHQPHILCQLAAYQCVLCYHRAGGYI